MQQMASTKSASDLIKYYKLCKMSSDIFNYFTGSSL